MHVDQIVQLISDGHYELAIEELSLMVKQHPGNVQEKTNYAKILVEDLMSLSTKHLHQIERFAYNRKVELAELCKKAGEQFNQSLSNFILSEGHLHLGLESDSKIQYALFVQFNAVERIHFALEECIKRIESSENVPSSDVPISAKQSSQISWFGHFFKKGPLLSQYQFNQLISLALKAYPHYDAPKVVNQDYDSDDDEMWSHEKYNDSNNTDLENYLEQYTSIVFNVYTSDSRFDETRDCNPMIVMQLMDRAMRCAQESIHDSFVNSAAIQNPDEKKERFITLLTHSINTKFETNYVYEEPSSFFGIQCNVS